MKKPYPTAARTSTLRVGLLVGCAVAALGCEGLVGPAPSTRVYLLASVAGVRLDSTVNLYDICVPDVAADGGELIMLADSILLHANGIGEESNLFRVRLPLSSRATPDAPAFLSPHRERFTYWWSSPDRTVYTRFERLEFKSRFRIASDGALEGEGICGTWRFERASARRAP